MPSEGRRTNGQSSLSVGFVALPAAGDSGLVAHDITDRITVNSYGPAPEVEWGRIFGGSDNDMAYEVQETLDGGYIFTGFTNSYGEAKEEVWLVKIDKVGNKEWDRTFGGPEREYGFSVQQTSDRGYILAGFSTSYGPGGVDVWLIKTDREGNQEWDRTFGGTPIGDNAFSVQETFDGGYILAGYTSNFGAGARDVWLIKTDADGNQEWDRTFGGPDDEEANCVRQTPDRGYVLAGRTKSFGAGDDDAWLIKTDADGYKEWDITFGGSERDSFSSVRQTSDGGYILAGGTNSFGAGSSDAWMVKTDAQGNKEWENMIGGPDYDYADVALQTSDGGYLLAGIIRPEEASFSSPGIVKTDREGNREWEATFDDSLRRARFAQQTSDGGYILLGTTSLIGEGKQDTWLIKLRDSVPTAVQDQQQLPAAYQLTQNYPNPFNNSTTIRFSLPSPERISLSIYNLTGQEVASLVSGSREAGEYTIHWDGTDDQGNELASGIYVYRLKSSAYEETKKLLLLR